MSEEEDNRKRDRRFLTAVLTLAVFAGIFFFMPDDTPVGQLRHAVLESGAGGDEQAQPHKEVAASSRRRGMFVPPPPGKAAPSSGVTLPAVLSWAALHVSEVMTFPRVPDLSKSRFTARGYGEYTAFLDQTGISGAVAAETALVSFPSAAPRLISEGEAEGVYSWTVSIPMTTRAGNADGEGHEDRKRDIVVKIVSTPAEDAPGGLLIDSWRAG